MTSAQDLIYHCAGTMRMGHTHMAMKGPTGPSNWRQGLQTAESRGSTATST